MARKTKLSPAARIDVANIADYGALEFGLVAAERYRVALEAKLQLIATFPDIGPADPAFGIGVRGLQAASHRILYRIETDHILILRILHTRQLPPGLD